MSSYKDFTGEFPKRCSDLLKVYPLAKWADREVTLLLSVASAGLTIPIERLTSKKHPYPFHDRANNLSAQVEIDKLLSSPFYTSTLLKSTQDWHFGKLASVEHGPDEWPELQNPKPLPNDKTVDDIIVKQLRNALAHGSIHTKGDPISELIFVASVNFGSKDFNYLIVSPDEFLAFMQNWFGFLEKLKFDA